VNRFETLLASIVEWSRRRKQANDRTGRLSLMAVSSGIGTAAATGIGVLLTVITHSPQVGISAFALAAPVTTGLGVLIGNRIWRQTIKTIARSDDPIDRRSLVEDEFQADLEQIEKLRVPDAIRIACYERVLARRYAALDALRRDTGFLPLDKSQTKALLNPAEHEDSVSTATESPVTLAVPPRTRS
jgi:hypothetical protein